jgi:hypothetical protein
MFTYSTNLRGTITATTNTLGGSAIMDDEEEKVKELFYLNSLFEFDFFE